MGSLNKASPNAAVTSSPPQSMNHFSSSTNAVQQDSTGNVSSGMQNGCIVPGNQRPDYSPKDCLDVSTADAVAGYKN